MQTTVPVMLTHVFHQKLSLERFVDLTSAGPRIYGIKNKGHIALGFDADFTVVEVQKCAKQLPMLGAKVCAVGRPSTDLKPWVGRWAPWYGARL